MNTIFVSAFADELGKVAEEKKKKGPKFEPAFGSHKAGLGVVGALGLGSGLAEASIGPGAGSRRRRFLRGLSGGTLGAGATLAGLEGIRYLAHRLRNRKKGRK